MLTKIVQVARRANFAILGCFLVAIFAIGVHTGAGAAPGGILHPSWRGNPVVQGANSHIRDDDRCYSTFSTGSSAISSFLGDSGVSTILKAIDPSFKEPKFGLVNAIVRLPIYDWDQTEIRAADAIKGFDSTAARPVGYAQEFKFDITPVPSLAWLKGLSENPDSILSVTGKVANPFLYQQASILGSNGLPVWRLFQGIGNHVQGYHPTEGNYRNNAFRQYADSIDAESFTKDLTQEVYEEQKNKLRSKLLAYLKYAVGRKAKAETHSWFAHTEFPRYIESNNEVLELAVDRAMEMRKNQYGSTLGQWLRDTFKIAIEQTPEAARIKGLPQDSHKSGASRYIDHWNDVQRPYRAEGISFLGGPLIAPRTVFATDDKLYAKVQEKNGGGVSEGLPNLGGIADQGKDLKDIIEGSFNFQKMVDNTVKGQTNASNKNDLLSGFNQFKGYTNLRPGDIPRSSPGLSAEEALNVFESQIGNMAAGLFGPTGRLANVQVRASDQYAMCYEYANAPDIGKPGAVPKVPSYAFSVPNTQLPIVIPGWLFSIQSMLIGKGPSFDGITFLFKGSYNNKMMLDCYGRGNTNTLRQDKEHDFIGKASLATLFQLLGALVGAVDDDTKQKAGWQTIGFIVETLTGSPTLLDNIKIPYVRQINYYNGLFNVYQVPKRESIVLPPGLEDREIDWEHSKLTWMEGIRDGRFFKVKDANHDASTNADVFFPHIFLRLKKPHNLKETIKPRDLTPDGTKGVETELSVHKGGYRDKSEPYNKHNSKNSGPIKESKLRVAEVVIKPGKTGSEIRNNDFYQHKGELRFGNGTDVNGLNSGEICRFWRERLGNENIAECNDGDNSEKPLTAPVPGLRVLRNYGEGSGRISLGKIRRDIPPETPPGTKFCYALYIDKIDNDIKYQGARYYGPHVHNFNPDYYAYPQKRYLSRAHCLISGYKPSLQVRGGDAIINGDVFTATNRKDRLGGSGGQRTYGSWAEYGLLVKGRVENAQMASGGLYRVGYAPNNAFDPHGLLTFANSYKRHSSSGGASNTDYGKFSSKDIEDGVERLQTFFSLRQANAKNINTSGCLSGTTITLRNCQSGDYQLDRNKHYKIDGAGFEAERATSLVFFVGGNVKLDFVNNLRLPESYESANDISQVVFTPAVYFGGWSRYNVNILPEATNIDAWILNPSGTINTCYMQGVTADTPRSYLNTDDPSKTPHPCYENRLVINGPVAVDKIYLRRSGGVDQNQNSPYTLRQSIAGETFNLRPDAYIWAMNQVSGAGRKISTTQLMDLPPRY